MRMEKIFRHILPMAPVALCFCVALAMLTLSGYSSAQPDAPLASSDDPDAPADVPLKSDSMMGDDSDPEQPPVTNLETGLPLDVLLTPLHWGVISLLSFTTFEGYSSNIRLQETPTPATITSMSALALYSRQIAGWTLNAQYRPFLLISSRQTVHSFGAGSVDLRTLRRINGNWR